MRLRDGFSSSSIRVIAQRAGYKCSYPGCQCGTIGPAISPLESVNVGEACHICAASPGGPRFDSTMTPEQRMSVENGIWMCRTHAAEIDRDVNRYTVALLKKWKKDAEKRADFERTNYNRELPHLIPESNENQLLMMFLRERLTDCQDILLFSSSSAASHAPIDEIYVSMPTNVTIDLLVKNGIIIDIYERDNEEDERLDRYNKSESSTLLNKYDKLQMFLSKLQKNIETGKEYSYPDEKERPLVISPPWSDGLKENYWILSIGDIITIYDRVVLLGEPGSGKSTSLRYLASRLIRNIVNLPYVSDELLSDSLFENYYIPIYLEIRDFTKWLTSQNKSGIELVDLKEYIFSLLSSQVLVENRELLWQELKQHNILFMFDGLDESASFSASSQLTHGKIRGLTAYLRSEFKNIKIVFSSRIGEYTDYHLPHYKHVKLVPMNKYIMRELAQKVYDYHSVVFDDLKISHFFSEIGNRSLKEDLTGNPLLLSLMVAIAMDSDGDEFSLPKQKAQILLEGIKLLIGRWYANENRPEFFKKYTENEILTKLKQFAYETKENGLINANELLSFMQTDSVNASEVLDYLLRRVGLIVKKGSDYEFAHKSFRSYLSASYIIEAGKCTKYLTTDNRSMFIREREEAVLVVDILFDSIKERERNDGAISQLWSIVTLLVCSPVQNEWDVWLAGTIVSRCDYLLISIENPLKEIVLSKLQLLLLDVFLKKGEFENQDLDINKRLECGDILGRLGDLRVGIGCSDGLPQISWCSIPSGVCSYGIDDSTQVLIRNTSWGKECDFRRETPLQSIYIDEFQISKYPITVCQFKAFLDSEDGYYNPLWYQWSRVAKDYYNSNIANKEFAFSQDIGFDNYPATNISFIDAIAFCKWLSDKMGTNIRLPSDAEWEYVAKYRNSLFTWGDEFDKDKCNNLASAIGHVCAVGSFSDGYLEENTPVDLSGNVWEWTQSFYTESHEFDTQNTIINTDSNDELSENTLIAERGGCYLSGPNSLRVSFRGRDPITSRADREGFRIIKQISDYTGEVLKIPNKQQSLTGLKAILERPGYGSYVNKGDNIKIWYSLQKNGVRVQQETCEFKLGDGRILPVIEKELINKKVAGYIVVEKKGAECYGDRMFCGVRPDDVLKFDVFILDVFE